MLLTHLSPLPIYLRAPRPTKHFPSFLYLTNKPLTLFHLPIIITFYLRLFTLFSLPSLLPYPMNLITHLHLPIRHPYLLPNLPIHLPFIYPILPIRHLPTATLFSPINHVFCLPYSASLYLTHLRFLLLSNFFYLLFFSLLKVSSSSFFSPFLILFSYSYLFLFLFHSLSLFSSSSFLAYLFSHFSTFFLSNQFHFPYFPLFLGLISIPFLYRNIYFPSVHFLLLTFSIFFSLRSYLVLF